MRISVNLYREAGGDRFVSATIINPIECNFRVLADIGGLLLQQSELPMD